MTIMRTWRMSSKSRAANFFISDTFEGNLRMVPRPNVDIWWYLATLVIQFNLPCNSKTYRRSSSMTNISVPPLAAYRRRIRCVKRVFQTPSSNSCKRSTTSILDGLKAGPSRSTKAFFDMCIKLLRLEKKMDTHFRRDS